jgi:hypothetical protein
MIRKAIPGRATRGDVTSTNSRHIGTELYGGTVLPLYWASHGSCATFTVARRCWFPYDIHVAVSRLGSEHFHFMRHLPHEAYSLSLAATNCVARKISKTG